MFRLWVKGKNKAKVIRSVIIPDEREINRTRKVLDCLEEACRQLDLPVPIWLETNIREFGTRARTRFLPDSFMESIPYDCVEIQVLEEDQELFPAAENGV